MEAPSGMASQPPAGASRKPKSLDDDSDDEPEQLQYKVILLGDGAVGKTSLAHRFTGDHFATTYKQTIGLDFFIKRLVLPGEVRRARGPVGQQFASPARGSCPLRR